MFNLSKFILVSVTMLALSGYSNRRKEQYLKQELSAKKSKSKQDKFLKNE